MDVGLGVEEAVDGLFGDDGRLHREALIEQLRSEVEDVAEDAVVDEVVFVVVEFVEVADVIVEEPELAAHVAVDGRGREQLYALAEDGHHLGGLGDAFGEGRALWRIRSVGRFVGRP